ncbi:MAG: biotin--[acetyl-CoA-carboxylase] ligase [Alphaproteobacteria bacterium]|nr:biotin--[acetyl-CoA-carboxylase] ligase [Alphaproteobacteria bacterium]
MTFIAIDDWQWIDYDTLKSTNDEAKKLIVEKSKIVVTAKMQTDGRGRFGHKWIGLDGNLFMTLGFSWKSENTNILGLISSLAIFNSIKNYKPDCDIMLKWPNDVLINNRKISGILLEIVPPSKVIIGIGVNICAAPDIDNTATYSATCLKEHGIAVDRIGFMRTYLEAFTNIVSTYQKEGQQKIIDMWLDNAHKIGQKITVRGEKTQISGEFAGLDKQGYLLLKTSDNDIKTISAGDIYF